MGTPPKEHQFKKGQSGNPKGRGVISEEQREAARKLRKLTIDSYREIIQLILDENIQGLKNIATDKDSNVLKVALATSVVKAIQRGDYTTIEKIVERIIGKIPDVIKIEGDAMIRLTVVDREVLKQAMAEIDGAI